jgi:hypothetical protein
MTRAYYIISNSLACALSGTCLLITAFLFCFLIAKQAALVSFKEAFAFLAFSPSFGHPPCDPVIVATVSVVWSVFVIGGSLHHAKNLRTIYLYTKKIQSTL